MYVRDMAKKKPRIRRVFSLHENADSVRARLAIPGHLGFDVSLSVQPVRAPYKRPTAKQLTTIANDQATLIGNTSPRHVLQRYIRAREKSIANSLDDIRRAIKRIESALICIENAEQAVVLLEPTEP